MKNCIIIGGSSFLGMNLAKALSDAGHIVTIADIVPPVEKSKLKNVKFQKISYFDSNTLKDLLKGQNILYHFAYSSLPGTSYEKMEEDIVQNVAYSISLFKAAVKSKVEKIIFPSSGGTVYGETTMLPIKETAETNPICSYGITKLMIEKYLYMFNKLFGIDYLIYRISNAYGPGQNPNGQQGLIANVLGKLIRSQKISIYGDGDTIRDYVYIDDVTRAFVGGIDDRVKNDIFNIGTGEGYSINEIINNCSNIVGKKPDVEYLPKRDIDIRLNILDSTKIKSLIDWNPNTDIREGIKKAYEWVKRNLK